MLCNLLGVTRSAYYSWKKCKISSSMKANQELLLHIKDIYKDSKGIYGAPRIQVKLREKGILCSKKRVASIMKEADIRSVTKRKFPKKTKTNNLLNGLNNLVERNFTATRPNQVWTADITYCPSKEGYAYLAVVMDIYSRKIVGWSISEKIDTNLVVNSLMMAYNARKPPVGLIHHSDRGCQYTSKIFQKLLTQLGIRASMSTKGSCYDNAVTESFFHSLKNELIRKQPFDSIDIARRKMFEYIAIFYNRERIHSTLGYVSPEQFEKTNKQEKVA